MTFENEIQKINFSHANQTPTLNRHTIEKMADFDR